MWHSSSRWSLHTEENQGLHLFVATVNEETYKIWVTICIKSVHKDTISLMDFLFFFFFLTSDDLGKAYQAA